MKQVDRLLLKAKRAFTPSDKELSLAFFEKEEDGRYQIHLVLWNGLDGKKSDAEDIIQDFDTKEEAEAFLQEATEKYPSKDRSPVILDASDGIPD